MEYAADTFDQVYRELMYDLSYHPDFQCAPRGQQIKENLVTTIQLNNPRARLLGSPDRETNYGFAVGEFLWYLRGADDLATMQYYNKRMAAFSNDGQTLNSAYGKRLRRDLFGDGRPQATQWDLTVQALLQDRDSRRAVMTINHPGDGWQATIGGGSKDVPCTLSLQFFIREGRLYLHTLMRSNDAVWGLTYDLFSFTLLQEVMLLELRQHPAFQDLQLGCYYHTAGSMHIYDRHFGMAMRIADDSECRAEPMAPLESLAELKEVLHYEKRMREGHRDTMVRGAFSPACTWMLDRLSDHAIKRDDERKAADAK